MVLSFSFKVFRVRRLHVFSLCTMYMRDDPEEKGLVNIK